MSFSPHFSLRLITSDTVQTVISVSKKLYKQAVVRNTIKRRIRPILREIKPTLKPAVYIVIIKAGAQNLRGEELKNELTSLIRSIRN
ncbi:MAG: ribonuclease P protein component [Candidatus Zambryskibacteria bacterium]|nr:ribonuclease P protein component [Candidatus Zambryskibacteria bacterium]